MKDKFTSHKSTASVSIYIVMEINLEGIGDMIKKEGEGQYWSSSGVSYSGYWHKNEFMVRQNKFVLGPEQKGT